MLMLNTKLANTFESELMLLHTEANSYKENMPMDPDVWDMLCIHSYHCSYHGITAFKIQKQTNPNHMI